MAIMPTAASASAATIVGTSSLSSSRRRSTGLLRARRRPRLERPGGGLPRRRFGPLRQAIREEHLEDLLRDRGGRGAAVAAVLDHDRERDLRGVGRGVPDEPRVVALVLGELVGVDPGRLL